MRRLALAVALLGAPACVRPRPVDVAALVAKDGLDGAADELRFRVASDTHDRSALAALGAVEERRGRPGAALDALARAEALGGPPGDRLPARDRMRLGALTLARAAERAARGAPTADDDLAEARRLGASVPVELEHEVALAAALAELRHTDPRTRAHGQARLAALVAATTSAYLPAGETGDARFTAAHPLDDAPSALALARYGASGAWLWDQGAKRAALDALDAWVAHGGLAASPPPPATVVEHWLAARAWWNGDAPADAPADAIERARALGASTCVVAAMPDAGCSPAAAAADPSPDGPIAEPWLWRRAEQRGWRGDDPAWLVLAARAWLRDDASSYVDAVRARLAAGPDAPELSARWPSWARPTLARLAGRPAAEVAAALDAAIAELSASTPRGARLVVAVEAALADRPAADVAAALGPAPGVLGQELLARATAPAPTAPAVPDLAHAAAARAARDAPPSARTPSMVPELAAIAAASLHDPALGDRAADDWIGRDVDVAVRAPIAAALYTALGDPARARALWQRALDASPGEPRVVRGLALAAAAVDDPDAALVLVTGSAAASGDPGPALVEVARAVAARGRYDHALELVQLAVQLVAPDGRAALYDLAIAWSHAEGKDTAELEAARAAAAPTSPAPTDATPAESSTEPSTADLVLAARMSPRAAAPRVRLLALPPAVLPADDPRRARARAELAAIAADPRASEDDAAAAWAAFAASAPPRDAARR